MANEEFDKNWLKGFVNFKHQGEINSWAEIDIAAWDTLTAEQRAELVGEQLADNVCEDGYIYSYGLYAANDAAGFERRYYFDECIKLTLEQLGQYGLLCTIWAARDYSSYKECCEMEGWDDENA